MDSDISAIKLSELTENDVIEHCRLRNNAGAGPATVSHDVSYLGSVLDAAKPIYGINYTSNFHNISLLQYPHTSYKQND